MDCDSNGDERLRGAKTLSLEQRLYSIVVSPLFLITSVTLVIALQEPTTDGPGLALGRAPGLPRI